MVKLCWVSICQHLLLTTRDANAVKITIILKLWSDQLFQWDFDCVNRIMVVGGVEFVGVGTWPSVYQSLRLTLHPLETEVAEEHGHFRPPPLGKTHMSLSSNPTLKDKMISFQKKLFATWCLQKKNGIDVWFCILTCFTISLHAILAWNCTQKLVMALWHVYFRRLLQQQLTALLLYCNGRSMSKLVNLRRTAFTTFTVLVPLLQLSLFFVNKASAQIIKVFFI